MSDLYNQYRLNKVKNNYKRTERYETEILSKKNRHLRELFIDDLVFLEAGRIKKKDQPGVLTKKTTDLKSHFNTKEVYKIINKRPHKNSGGFEHYFYYVEGDKSASKNLENQRFGRDELFALVNNSIS